MLLSQQHVIKREHKQFILRPLPYKQKCLVVGFLGSTNSTPPHCIDTHCLYLHQHFELVPSHWFVVIYVSDTLECKLVIFLEGNTAEDANTIFSRKDCFVNAVECS
jgi:hypothetical protein